MLDLALDSQDFVRADAPIVLRLSRVYSKVGTLPLFLPSPRYHDELFVAPGISIMMIDTSLSKRTFLIDFATRNLLIRLSKPAHVLTLATAGLLMASMM